MKRYAVNLTKDDDVNILGVRETKEEAMLLGAELRKQHPRDEGLMTCIEADFDADGHIIGNAYRLLETFR